MRIRAMGLSATLITSAPASESRLAPASSLCGERPLRGLHFYRNGKLPFREPAGQGCRLAGFNRPGFTLELGQHDDIGFP